MLGVGKVRTPLLGDSGYADAATRPKSPWQIPSPIHLRPSHLVLRLNNGKKLEHLEFLSPVFLLLHLFARAEKRILTELFKI